MTSKVKYLAEEFVEDYLQRDVEYSDITDFLWDNGHDGEVDPSEVYDHVLNILDVILQRWVDSES